MRYKYANVYRCWMLKPRYVLEFYELHTYSDGFRLYEMYIRHGGSSLLDVQTSSTMVEHNTA